MGRMPKRRPSFFKVLIGDYTKRLQIPPAFVKNLKGISSKEFILKTDDGKLWAVNMKRIDEDYFFINGWKKFVKDCRLEVGEFLVFWFVADSTFDVLTFGRSGCPKNINAASGQNRGYPSKDKPHVSVKMENDSEGVVQADGFPQLKNPYFTMILKQQNRYTIAVPRGFAAETGMAGKSNGMLRDSEGRAWKVIINERRAGQKRNMAVRFELRSGWSECRKANNVEEGDECLFEFIEEKGYVIHVHILRQGASGAVVPNESHSRIGCPKNVNSAVKKYSDLSGQTRGNPCKDKSPGPGINVNPAGSLVMKMGTGREGVVKAAAGFAKPNNPYFIVILKEWDKYAICVPKGFVEETGMARKRDGVLRDPKGRAWQVLICKSRTAKKSKWVRFKLGGGWSECRKANKLAEGDACLFEFIREREYVIHVHIRRKGGSGAVETNKSHSRSGCLKNVNSVIKRHSDLAGQNRGNPCKDKSSVPGTGSEGMVKAAGFAKPNNPFFVMSLKGLNKSTIYVPKGFAVETGMARKRNGVLRDPEGRAWQIKILERRLARQNNWVRFDLVGDWSKCVKANKLADGDACLFEFIRGRDYVIRVHMRRKANTCRRRLFQD